MENDSDNRFVQGFKKHLIRNIVLIVLLVVGLVYASFINNTFNEGNTLQNNITGLERNIHTGISTCLDNTRIAAQIAEEEFESIKDVLTNVVSARYEGESGADAALKGGAFVSALAEQYPSIDQTTWKLLMSEAVGCRKNVQDEQNRLGLAVTGLKNWTETGSLFTKPFRATYPDDKLYTLNRKTGEMLHGQQALDYLKEPITTDDAKKAIADREMPAQDPFEDK